ncbi:MAG: hypothetical protein KAR45_15505, partial [Desulfobacteraceae bacterium]|nr:hypothetical protein [Desulfobacteraceae bacterium]
EGENIIIVTARDEAGNESTDQLTIAYVMPDVTDPSVVINSPTSDTGYNTIEPNINISGTTSDDSGVTQVIWSNSAGGSGTATDSDESRISTAALGMTSWSVSDISLSVGENVITITASDATGNTSSDSITIMYQPTPGDSWTMIMTDGFESGFGNYIDGGRDCSRSDKYKNFAHQGDYCIRLQDNSGQSSSIYSARGIDIHTPGFKELKIEFWYYPFSFEAGEDFFVEYYDGRQVHIIAQYVVGRDFDNGSLYHEEGIILKEGAPLIFPANMRIRIRCDASGNYDRVYIDDVIISAR